MDDPLTLGSVLTVWAHPDDETYLAGGLLAALAGCGHRVVCVTATRGEAGGPVEDSERLAVVRSEELEAALEILDVREHHWLDHADGRCDEVDSKTAAARITEIIDEVAPDTVLTFGPDGFTGHADHRAVSRWVDLALARSTATPRLLHAVAGLTGVDRQLDEEFGVFELGQPRRCADEEMDLRYDVPDWILDLKVDALVRQESQTAGLIEAVGLPRFRAWVAREAFARPQSR